MTSARGSPPHVVAMAAPIATTFRLADGTVVTAGEALPKSVPDSQPIVLLPCVLLNNLCTQPFHLNTTVGDWRTVAKTVLHFLEEDGFEGLVNRCTRMAKYLDKMRPRIVQLRKKVEQGDARAAQEHSKYVSAVVFLLGFMVVIQHKEMQVVLEMPAGPDGASTELPCFLVTENL